MKFKGQGQGWWWTDGTKQRQSRTYPNNVHQPWPLALKSRDRRKARGGVLAHEDGGKGRGEQLARAVRCRRRITRARRHTLQRALPPVAPPELSAGIANVFERGSK